MQKALITRETLFGWDMHFRTVAVTEFRISASPKAVIIGHDPPNEGHVPQPVGKQGCNISSRLCSGRQNDAPLEQVANRKPFNFGCRRLVFSNHHARGFHAAVPAHVSCWQVTDVSKDHATTESIASVRVRHQAPRLYREIGPLDDLGIAALIANSARRNDPQPDRRCSENSGEESDDESVEGDRIVRRPLPEAHQGRHRCDPFFRAALSASERESQQHAVTIERPG